MQHVEIRIKGMIDKNWYQWFDCFTISYTRENESTLTGLIRDQAQLRGVLSKLSDLGLDLVAVNTKFMNNTRMLKKGGDR